MQADQAFRGYAMTYKVDIIEKKDLIVQLEASKSSITDLFSDLINETKIFKYQITVKVLLQKYKLNKEIEIEPAYFNSVIKTIIDHIFRLENSFQEILYILMFGLIVDLAGILNQLSLSSLIFQFIDNYQKVLI